MFNLDAYFELLKVYVCHNSMTSAFYLEVHVHVYHYKSGGVKKLNLILFSRLSYTYVFNCAFYACNFMHILKNITSCSVGIVLIDAA